VFNFDFTALKSTIAGDDYYGLSVMVDNQDGNGWVRQRLGTDYTNTSAAVTFTTAPAAGTGNVKIVYSSASQPQTFAQGVHVGTAIPAGVRGRDIQVRLGDGAATPSFTEWLGVQSANVDWRVTLERDLEFNNPQVVAVDFNVPEVTGAITMRPQNVDALFTQIQRIAGLTGTDIANATADPPELQVEFKITDPDTGNTLKTLYVVDAKFQVPALQGSVGSKLEGDFSFQSASGNLEVYKADR
jgi:hypothetical protein